MPPLAFSLFTHSHSSAKSAATKNQCRAAATEQRGSRRAAAPSCSVTHYVNVGAMPAQSSSPGDTQAPLGLPEDSTRLRNGWPGGVTWRSAGPGCPLLRCCQQLAAPLLLTSHAVPPAGPPHARQAAMSRVRGRVPPFSWLRLVCWPRTRSAGRVGASTPLGAGRSWSSRPTRVPVP